MAQSLSRAYKTRPQTPLDLARWSIINVIENGAMEYERSYAPKLPWYIYYSLDVILVLLLAAITIVFGVSYGCRKLCCGKQHLKSTKSNAAKKKTKKQ